MRALIIDDEKKARQVLQILVEENCPKITTILQADNLMSGVELIKQEAPNIVFLDIEMPEHSGLEILNFIEEYRKTKIFLYYTIMYSLFDICYDSHSH